MKGSVLVQYVVSLESFSFLQSRGSGQVLLNNEGKGGSDFPRREPKTVKGLLGH